MYSASPLPGNINLLVLKKSQSIYGLTAAAECLDAIYIFS